MGSSDRRLSTLVRPVDAADRMTGNGERSPDTCVRGPMSTVTFIQGPLSRSKSGLLLCIERNVWEPNEHIEGRIELRQDTKIQFNQQMENPTTLTMENKTKTPKITGQISKDWWIITNYTNKPTNEFGEYNGRNREANKQ